jgi:hypothetical protein
MLLYVTMLGSHLWAVMAWKSFSAASTFPTFPQLWTRIGNHTRWLFILCCWIWKLFGLLLTAAIVGSWMLLWRFIFFELWNIVCKLWIKAQVSVLVYNVKKEEPTVTQSCLLDRSVNFVVTLSNASYIVAYRIRM